MLIQYTLSIGLGDKSLDDKIAIRKKIHREGIPSMLGTSKFKRLYQIMLMIL